MAKLYHHGTDGGAEYLCAMPVEGTNEGDLYTAIVRLDGEPELINAVYEAAPDLLEALTRLALSVGEADALQHAGLLIPQDIWAEIYSDGIQARAAIAKAKGG